MVACLAYVCGDLVITFFGDQKSNVVFFKYNISDLRSDTIVSKSCFKLLFKETLQPREEGWVEKLAVFTSEMQEKSQKSYLRP